MSNIHPFVRTRPFDPALADAMGLAFESAWQRLLVSGTHLALSAYAASTREALAMHIIDLAERGERDVHRLREGAVAFVMDALQCKQADVARTANGH